MKKWIRYVPDRIDDGLRYLCGRMSPDVRLVCVVVMLTGFGCLSIYMTVSSIYRIGRHEGCRKSAKRNFWITLKTVM